VSRRFFTAGSIVLLALGLVHLLGHYSLVTGTGDNEAERQLLSAMRGYRRDMGAGFAPSTMDILSGFSLTFSVLPLGLGLLGLVLRRHAGVPGLLRAAATVYAGTFGIMTGVAWRYWFPAPLVFLAAAFACFALALARAGRARAA
jgi:hypothetical protein